MWIHDPDHAWEDPLWLGDLTRVIADVAHSRMFERLYEGTVRAELTWAEAREIVEVWADHPQMPENPRDKRSMSSDLERAAKHLLNNSFDAAIQQAVNEFLAVLPDRLEEQRMAAVREAAAKVTRTLTDHDGSGAVFEVLCAHARSDTPIEDLVFWCEQLCDVVALAGRSAPQVLLRIREVLRDNALTIADELETLEAGDSDSVGDLANQRAGLDVTERIDLSLDILSRSPDAGHIVVWLFIANAREFMGVKTVGPVTFVDGHLWLSLMQADGEPDDPRLPLEVRNHPLNFKHLPDVENDRFVLARVDLGKRLFAGAVELAEQNVRAIGQLSRFWGLSTWKLWRGDIVVVDGVPVPSAGFFPPDRTNVDEHPVRDGTSYVLGEIDEKLGSQLPITDPALANLLDSIEDLNAARDSPDDLQLITAVRAVDHVARWTEQKWYDLLVSTYRYAWPLWRFSDELRQVAFRAVKDVSDVDRERFLELDRAIVNETTHLSWSINPREAVSSFDELIGLLGDRWPQVRRLVWVRDLSQSASLLSKVVEDGAADFDVLIWRSRRLRNSIFHGGPQEKGSLRTVVPLVMSLARTAVNDALHAVVEGVSIAGHLESVRDYYEWQASGLRADQDVLDTLLTPFPLGREGLSL